tara:strand:+ start:315 stop:1463 length:1149 start_codon:yes stop_codon:yes gene_type:complete
MEKILLIHTKYQNFGGEDQSIINEVELLKTKFNVKTLMNTNKITNIINDLITIVFNRNFLFEKKLRKDLKEFNPDFIYVHNTWFKVSLGIFKILNEQNKPVVIKLHNFRYHCTENYLHKNHLGNKKICEACGIQKNSKKIFNKYFENSYIKSFFAIKYGKKYLNILKNSKVKIVLLTDFHKQFLIKKGINQNRITVIPNFISIKDTKKNTDSNNYFVYAGRVSKEKGLFELLETFNKLKMNEVSLKIIGDGPLLSSLKKKYLNNSKFVFLGNTKNDEVLSIMSRSIGVVTATKLYEGQPTLLCEASSLGVPSIFPKTGGINEFFPKDYIYSYNQFDYKDLAEQLEKMINDTELKKIGIENQKFISNMLDEEEIVKMFKKVFI